MFIRILLEEIFKKIVDDFCCNTIFISFVVLDIFLGCKVCFSKLVSISKLTASWSDIPATVDVLQTKLG